MLSYFKVLVHLQPFDGAGSPRLGNTWMRISERIELFLDPELIALDPEPKMKKKIDYKALS